MNVFDIMEQGRNSQYTEANGFLTYTLRNNNLNEIEVDALCEYLPTQPRFNLTEKNELVALSKEIKADINYVQNFSNDLYNKIWNDFLNNS